MEITQLKCFLAVVRERNFTRAAAACHLTQPSLSYQIAKLEDELGEPLFRRRPRDVELTAAGGRLRASAVLIVGEQERALAQFQAADGGSAEEIHCGVIPTVAPYLLPVGLRRFRTDFPKPRLVVREGRTAQLIQDVVKEDLAFAIVSDVEPALLKRHSLHLKRLFSERLVLAVPSAHPLASQTALPVRAVNAEELILMGEGNCLRDQTVRVCRAQERESALVCEQLPTQLALVAAGLGLAIVPEMAVRAAVPPGVELVRFKEPAPTRLIGLLQKRGRKLGPAATQFVAHLVAGAS